jgi:hypothetical protein
MLDSVGRKMTEVLTDVFLRRFQAPRHVPSQFTLYRQQYIFPFSSDFGETARSASNLGYNMLDTLEQLVIVTGRPADAVSGYGGTDNFLGWPVDGNTNVQITIFSYDYAALNCNGGVAQCAFT